MKILIVEDQNELRGLVRKFLEKNGYVVDEAQDGEEGLQMSLVNEYDCILLDLNLPKLEGMQIAKRLKKEKIGVPVVMLTARSQIYDKLEGFENGADDYITKPFDMKELLARIKVVLRRGKSVVKDSLYFASYEVFPSSNLIKREKEEIELSNKEMGILEYLVLNEGEIVPAEELLEHVWNSDIDIFSQTVKTHIKTLRQKIDPKKKYIKTVRGKGYVYKN